MANEEAAKETIKIVNEVCRIDDVSFFFLNETFSDLNVVVEGCRLPAHKVILSTRCRYFQLLLQEDPQQDELQVADVTVDVFTNILRYVYTGEISLALETNCVLDLIKIAHKYSLQSLQDGLTEKLPPLLTIDNVCTILNYSNVTDLERIREVCHQFMDQQISDFRGSDLLNSLTQQSMVKFLERDSLLLPEIEIFDLAQRWIKSNADTDKLVANCVRWSFLTKNEIYSIVRPSKVVDSDTLLDILHDLVIVDGSRTTRYRTGPNERYADQLDEDIRVTVEVLELPINFSKDSIDSSVIEEAAFVIDSANVCSLLNTAKLYDLRLLQRACYSFMDEHSLEIVSNHDSLKTLTQESMVGLLSRGRFLAPEVEIFRCVSKWYSSNPNADDSVWKCVKFVSMTIDELTTIVWPTRQVAPAKLFEVIEKITTGQNKFKFQSRSSNKNYVSSFLTDTLAGTNAAWAQVNSRNVHNFVYHYINCGSGIIVQMFMPVYINHIRMMLREDDARYYSYWIEISEDKSNWKKVIDYSDVPCRGLQELYFDHQRARYIKIIGTKASIGQNFEIEFIETYFRSSVPKTLKGIVCAARNLIVPHKNAVVRKGFINKCIFLRHKFYVAHGINDGGVVIQLSQPFVVSKVKLSLSSYCNSRYYIETSMDETKWNVVVDCRNNDCSGEQEHYFEARSVVFFRITGTLTSRDFAFECTDFECTYESRIA